MTSIVPFKTIRHANKTLFLFSIAEIFEQWKNLELRIEKCGNFVTSRHLKVIVFFRSFQKCQGMVKMGNLYT